MDLGIEGLSDAEEIGRGGFSVVYRARQERFDRQVAVKVVTATLDSVALARFERECRAVGGLSWHPHIVTVFDAATLPDGRPYLAMEYLSGGSLARRLKTSGPMSVADVLAVGIGVARALAAAHGAGILHRDIKPENILVNAAGAPVLADFGIAWLGEASLTDGGAVLASLAHAAPEVLAGAKASVASDVYSLASALMALLRGRAPFSEQTDETPLAMVVRVANQPVPDLRPLGVPDAVCAALEKAMAKDPADRPADAEEFAAMLQEAASAEGVQPTVALAPLTEDVADLPADPVFLNAGEPTSFTRLRRAPREVAPEPEPVSRSRLRFLRVLRPGAQEQPASKTPEASEPAVAEVVPAARRRPRWLVPTVGAAAVVLVAVAAVVLVGGGKGGAAHPTTAAASTPAHHEFAPVAYKSGLTSTTTWDLSAGTLKGGVAVSNPGARPVSDSIDVVIPKSVATDVSQVTFNIRPTEVVSRDPVVRFRVSVPPHGVVTVYYKVNVKGARDAAKQLAALAADEDTAVAATQLPKPGSGPAALVAFVVAPASLSMQVGQTIDLQLSGRMSDGTVAPALALKSVKWSSSNTSVISIDGVTVSAVGPGKADIFGTVGNLKRRVHITVHDSPDSPPADGGSGSSGTTVIAAPPPPPPPPPVTTYVPPPATHAPAPAPKPKPTTPPPTHKPAPKPVSNTCAVSGPPVPDAITIWNSTRGTLKLYRVMPDCSEELYVVLNPAQSAVESSPAGTVWHVRDSAGNLLRSYVTTSSPQVHTIAS